ncbi:hypothetical protein M2161_009206 [Streptomyces sp. SAI-133]|nr:hypothetical protein [Streptomyces sp. SAI-133]
MLGEVAELDNLMDRHSQLPHCRLKLRSGRLTALGRPREGRWSHLHCVQGRALGSPRVRRNAGAGAHPHPGLNTKRRNKGVPETLALMNPMHFIQRHHDSRSRHWWVRLGTSDPTPR